MTYGWPQCNFSSQSKQAAWPSGKASLFCSTETLKMKALGVRPGNLATRGPREIITAQSLCLFIPCYLLFRAPPRFEIHKKLRYQIYVKDLRSRQALRSGLPPLLSKVTICYVVFRRRQGLLLDVLELFLSIKNSVN